MLSWVLFSYYNYDNVFAGKVKQGIYILSDSLKSYSLSNGLTSKNKIHNSCAFLSQWILQELTSDHIMFVRL